VKIAFRLIGSAFHMFTIHTTQTRNFPAIGRIEVMAQDKMPASHLMVVGVMTSHADSLAKKHATLAETIGSTIANMRFHLLTGGGSGLMKAVGQAFLNKKQNLSLDNEQTGNLISILRARQLSPLNKQSKREWQPNDDNGLGEIVIRAHLPYSGDDGRDTLSRNHINALTSDLIVVLPGGSGTFSELQLAWEYSRDIMLFLGRDKVNGKDAEQLKHEFAGIKSGEAGPDLEDWLKKERDKWYKKNPAQALRRLEESKNPIPNPR
jgi:predicted Rossmann-fold nucleotide-binding protein